MHEGSLITTQKKYIHHSRYLPRYRCKNRPLKYV
nr:MAG TPA: hypothetical protein [Caudoviricetes sp.]